MAISFLATLIAASVVLVPKTGTIEKRQSEIPAELIEAVPAEAKVIKKEEKKEGVIVLRKAKKPKVSKNQKNKKNKYGKNKDGKTLEGPSTEFDHENLD